MIGVIRSARYGTIAFFYKCQVKQYLTNIVTTFDNPTNCGHFTVTRITTFYQRFIRDNHFSKMRKISNVGPKYVCFLWRDVEAKLMYIVITMKVNLKDRCTYYLQR